jgi:hypothetical protein
VLLDVDSAASRAGVRPPTIRQWHRRGYLRSYRRRVYSQSGRIVLRAFYDEREVLLAERQTRHRGGSRLD